MSFLYPRRVTVSRPGAQAGEGKLGYGGETQATETAVTPPGPLVVSEPVPANIELRREGQGNPTGLPGTGRRPMYDIRIPRRSLPLGTVRKLDIITDDQGDRYQVVSPYWNSLGYALRVEILEA